MHNKFFNNKQAVNTNSAKHLGDSLCGMHMSRRQAVGLLVMGALSLTCSQLTACDTSRNRKRIAMMEQLLSERYSGREFEIIGGDYGYESSLHPTVYCIERGIDDLVFDAGFQINEERIIYDSFVDRHLGRQVEDLIINRFKKHGIEAAPIGAVYTLRKDPDITLNEFIALGEELDEYFFDIVIPESIESPRISEAFLAAMLEVYEYIKTSNGMLILVARNEDFAAYQEYVRHIHDFYAPRDPKRPIIDGFYVRGPAPQLTIEEGDTWKQYSR